MKVLWITNSPSGVANAIGRSDKVDRGWIDSLERKLSAAGAVELSVVFPSDMTDVQSFENDGITYWAVPRTVLPRGFSRWWNRMRHRVDDPQILERILSIAKKIAPDIIQIWGTEDAYGTLISSMPAPAVIHIQGNITVYTKKRFIGISFIDAVRTTNLLEFLRGWGPLHDYYEVVRIAKREAQVFKSCKYFMGRTDWDRRLTSVLAPGATYYYCDELLREPFWQNTWQPHERNRFVLCTTIMGAPYKGFETICECAQLLKQIGITDFEWKVVGLGPSDHTTQTVQRTRGIDLSSINVSVLGRKSAKDLICDLIDADVYIHPSHIENSPNSICEAMLLGMPIVATYAGGTPSLITDRHDGLMVQDGDPYAMTGAILELLRDREYASALGRNARERAMVRHDPDHVVKTLLSIYQDILGKEQGHVVRQTSNVRTLPEEQHND